MVVEDSWKSWELSLVCRECLPTVYALALKHVDVDVICPWCHGGLETNGHVLFECDFAKTVWRSSEVKDLIQFVPGDTVFDVINCCFSACTRDQCAVVGMLCWSI